jgi:hypothetical protein
VTPNLRNIDLGRRVSFVVELEGSDWTIAEVRRTLGAISGLDLLEVSNDGGSEYLVIAGRPVAVGAAVNALAVQPRERSRVLTRLRSEFGIDLRADQD